MCCRVLLGILVILAAGCGGSKFVPVSGKVTMDGKPLPNVHVMFQPIGSQTNRNPGPTSHGITDENGVFTLREQRDGGPGAVVGPHRIKILAVLEGEGFRSEWRETGSPDGEKAVPPVKLPKNETIPVKYNEQSELTFEVPPGGTDQANFSLNSKP